MAWLGTAVATVAFVAGLAAQGKPDFSGKWTLVPDPNAAAAGGGGGGGGRGGGRGGFGGGGFCGQECTITQDASTLTISRMTQNGEVKTVYKLDGSESKNTQQGRGGAVEITSKAMWDGSKLSVETTRPGRDGGTPITTKTVVSMSGGQMEVENSGGPGGNTNKQTYKKG